MMGLMGWVGNGVKGVGVEEVRGLVFCVQGKRGVWRL